MGVKDPLNDEDVERKWLSNHDEDLLKPYKMASTNINLIADPSEDGWQLQDTYTQSNVKLNWKHWKLQI